MKKQIPERSEVEPSSDSFPSNKANGEDSAGEIQRKKSDWVTTSRKGRTIVVFLAFLFAFLLTAPHPYYIIAIWAFPLGLAYWHANWYDLNNISNISLILFLGWSLYLVLSSIIIFSNNKKILLSFFALLILLLLLNIHGCQVQDANYW